MAGGIRLVAKSALFVLCGILCATNISAFDEKSRIYEYNANVSVGVEEPHFLSKFEIKGFIVVERSRLDEEKQVYKISPYDFKLNTYYGPESLGELHGKTATNDLRQLKDPFLAVYSEDGKFLEVIKSTNSKETKEIVNLKKSIALGLQFNWGPIVNALNAFGVEKILKEQNVHGSCDVKYCMKDPTTFTITKMYKPNECSNFIGDIRGYDAYFSNYKGNVQSQIKTDVHCTYELDPSVHFLKDMSCSEKYTWDMNVEMSYSDYKPDVTQPTFIQMNQRITHTHYDLDVLMSNHKIGSLKNIQNDHSENDTSNSDETDKIEKIKEFFITTVSSYIKENRLIRHKADVVNQQVFNRLQSVLDELNLEELEKLYTEINSIESSDMKDLRSIFIQMIPYIGTKNSTLFLRDMITKQEISEKLAVNVLKILPSFIRQPTKELLIDLEMLILINNGLTPRVKNIGILSFAYLISRVYKDSNEPDDVLTEKYLKQLNIALESETNVEMQVVYLHAFGNTRSHEAVKYLVPILFRQNDSMSNALSINRLRIAAIHALSRVIDASDESTIENLKKLLLDNKELRSLRLAAYDVLFNVLKSDTSKLDDLDSSITLVNDNHVKNYHRSNIQNHETLEALPKELSHIANRIRHANVSPMLSRSLIVPLNDNLKAAIVNFCKILMISPRLGSFSKIRLSNVLESGFAASLKYEVLESVKNSIDVAQGLYWYSNAENITSGKGKGQKGGVSINRFDVWLKSGNWINDVYSFNVSKDFEDRISELTKKFYNYIGEINNEPSFEYKTFTSVSVPTLLGIDAVFEHKTPFLRHLKMNVDVKEEENTVKITKSMVFASWQDGYIGASVNNVDDKLMHSVRKTYLFDDFIPNKLSFNYDTGNSTWNIIYSIITDKDENSLKDSKGSSLYTAVNVMIDKTHGLQIDNSCDVCGYQLVKNPISPQKMTNKMINNTFDAIGLSSSTTLYDCDITFHEPVVYTMFEGLFTRKSSFTEKYINNCGMLVKLTPNLNKTISQIELQLSNVGQFLQTRDKPWYSLPGFEFDLKISLTARKTLDNDAINLGILNINAGTTQGHIISNLKIKFSAKHDERRNFVFCCEMVKTYPNVSDAHLPPEASQKYSTSADIRATVGFSTDQACSDSIFSIDSNLIGSMSENHLDALGKHARNSRCALQKATPLFAHPLGSFPLTWDCIYESILNTTLRHYTLNINHKSIPIQFLLIANSILEKIKNYYSGINIKLVSPINRALVDTVTYEIDYPITQRSFHNFTFVETMLDNAFYSKSFIHKFMNGSINVTNIFPKIILFDKNKVISNANLTNWKRVYADKVGSGYDIYVKLVNQYQLSLKVDDKENVVILEPSMLLNFEKEGFLKVDNYIVIQPDNSLVSAFYTENSVTILSED